MVKITVVENNDAEPTLVEYESTCVPTKGAGIFLAGNNNITRYRVTGVTWLIDTERCECVSAIVMVKAITLKDIDELVDDVLKQKEAR